MQVSADTPENVINGNNESLPESNIFENETDLNFDTNNNKESNLISKQKKVNNVSTKAKTGEELVLKY